MLFCTIICMNKPYIPEGVVDDITARVHPLNGQIIDSLYENGKTSLEISKEIGIDRTDVSAVLIELREYSIVKNDDRKIAESENGGDIVERYWLLDGNKMKEIGRKLKKMFT